jgi:hypothetical protein
MKLEGKDYLIMRRRYSCNNIIAEIKSKNNTDK